MSAVAAESHTGRLARPSLLPECSEPTWDKAAEQATLGGALLMTEVLEQVSALLVPQDFFLISHQKIFAAILGLREKGVAIDPITVAHSVADDQDVIVQGGSNYIWTLPQLSAPALNAPHHARIVRALSRRRATHEVARKLLEDTIDAAGARAALANLGTEDLTDALPTVSAPDFCREVPEEPDWVMQGYLARGAITELDAKIKTGKTHFTCDLIRAVLAGEEFLDRPTTATTVLYLTEERRTSFRAVLARVGLDEAAGLEIAFRHGAKAAWSEMGRTVVARAQSLGAGLVIVDTLSDWAGLEADKENDAGAALEAMRPLQEMTAAGLAVLVLRHERKSGGEVGDSARGSSAFGGAADILLSLQKDPSLGHENRRVLGAVGRLEGWAPRLLIEMTDGRYRSLGTSAQVEAERAKEIIMAALPTDETEALTERQLLDLPEAEVSRSTLKRGLADLVVAGQVKKAKGAGSASTRAFGFWLAEQARS